jgi:C-terminal processing protease CtpA/Prc
VRSFGQPTAGATSANKSIRLSNGGLLALSTSRILDRTGTGHAGPVLPDVVTDQAPHAASEWVEKGCVIGRHTWLESAVRSQGIEVDDALEIAEQTDV